MVPAGWTHALGCGEYACSGTLPESVKIGLGSWTLNMAPPPARSAFEGNGGFKPRAPVVLIRVAPHTCFIGPGTAHLTTRLSSFKTETSLDSRVIRRKAHGPFWRLPRNG